jgi:hypothetical protein
LSTTNPIWHHQEWNQVCSGGKPVANLQNLSHLVQRQSTLAVHCGVCWESRHVQVVKITDYELEEVCSKFFQGGRHFSHLDTQENVKWLRIGIKISRLHKAYL